jgi:hypothetical protein
MVIRFLSLFKSKETALAIQLTNMDGRTEMLLSGGNFPEVLAHLRHMDKNAQEGGQCRVSLLQIVHISMLGRFTFSLQYEDVPR